METKTQTPQSQSQNQTVFSKLQKLRLQLHALLPGRSGEIDGVLVGLVSGEPTLLVGPPGTGKTMLVELLSRHLNARYFYYLLTRFTEPDEILGPIDIQSLMRGERKRITKNRLPDADVIFLDEVFKASSAIRNILLDIILNKRFYDGGEYVRLPVIAFYFASNEVSYDAEDAAFLDRMTIRLWPQYIGTEYLEELLRRGVMLTVNGLSIQPVISVDEIRQLQAVTRQSALALLSHIDFAKLKEILTSIKATISDRSLVKTVIVASAICVVYAMDCTRKEAVMDALLEALLLIAPRSLEEYRELNSTLATHFSWSDDAKMLQGAVADLETVVAELRGMKISMDASSTELTALRELLSRGDAILEKLTRVIDNVPKTHYVIELARRGMKLLQEFNNIKKKAEALLQ